MAVKPQESCDVRKLRAIADGPDSSKVVCGQGAQQSQPQNQAAGRDSQWAAQLEYLKRNAVKFEPETRRMPTPQSGTGGTNACSTFSGGITRDGCPTPAEVAAMRARQEAEETERHQERSSGCLGWGGSPPKGAWLFAPLTDEERKAWEAKQAADAEKRRKEEASRPPWHSKSKTENDCDKWAMNPIESFQRETACMGRGTACKIDTKQRFAKRIFLE